MLKLFASGKADHAMADPGEARKLLDALPASDPHKALEELTNWLESVSAAEGFRPDRRAQVVQMLDEAAQVHVRKLQREYFSNPGLSKVQEHRLWSVIHAFWKRCGFAFASCVDLYATGKRGANRLKPAMPLLMVRALRALAAQMKWQYIRYGPFDNSIWGIVAKVYALAETRELARIRVQVYPAVEGDSSPEQEFLKAVMLAACSPDSLLPVEMDVVERLIAHFSASFTLSPDQQSDVAYCVDLAASQPPLRLARPPQHPPTLRFFAAGEAARELEPLIQAVSATHAVPSNVGLGDAYEPAVVLDALRHLALCWSPDPPARKAPRHKVKSRLSATHGFGSVLAVLDPSSLIEIDERMLENWIVENVSMGGFGAVIPQFKGDWLKIGCLLALQPDGGKNWVIGVIRRLSRESWRQGTVGIQTLARNALPVTLRLQAGQAGQGAEAEIGILLEPSEESGEARCLLRVGALAAGQNMELERDGKLFLLLPSAVVEQGDDYELVRFKQMRRDASE
jgi:hypothetical protein